jgi:hypothetical protein
MEGEGDHFCALSKHLKGGGFCPPDAQRSPGKKSYPAAHCVGGRRDGGVRQVVAAENKKKWEHRRVFPP